MSANTAISYDFGTPTASTSSTSRALAQFANVVFDTSFQGKAEVANALQYSLLATVPALFMSHIVHQMTPEPNYAATAFMLSMEICFQVVLVVCAFILFHRIITTIPTLSGVQYERINFVTPLLPMLIIFFSMHSKLATKGRMLLERLGWYPIPNAPAGAASGPTHPGIPSSSAATMTMRPTMDPVVRPMAVR